MGFFKKLSGLFTGAKSLDDASALWITVRCNRCGEVIHARVNLYNDLSVVYDDDGTHYYCRKQLIGEGNGELPCFQRIEVELTFDEKRKLISKDISGGQFLTE